VPSVFSGGKPYSNNQNREAATEAKLSRIKSLIAEISAD
jgi:hypothetical protein